jgi:hypothetical protein
MSEFAKYWRWYMNPVPFITPPSSKISRPQPCSSTHRLAAIDRKKHEYGLSHELLVPNHSTPAPLTEALLRCALPSLGPVSIGPRELLIAKDEG